MHLSKQQEQWRIWSAVLSQMFVGEDLFDEQCSCNNSLSPEEERTCSGDRINILDDSYALERKAAHATFYEHNMDSILTPISSIV